MNSNLSIDDKDKIGFYIIHNSKTDETYVGSGVLGQREYSHIKELKEGTHSNRKLQAAYNEDPNFDFIAVPVDEHKTVEENRLQARLLEQSIIDEFKNSDLLLNISLSAFACRPDWTQEQRDQQSIITKNYNSNLSEEDKVRISNRSKERFKDPEVRKKNGDIFRKLWKDPEFRNKQIIMLKNLHSSMSEEEKKEYSEKLSKAGINRYKDPEAIEQARRITTELWQEPNFRENHSAAGRLMWQDPEYRENQSNRMKGNTFALGIVKTKEQILKHKLYQTERMKDPEARKKVSETSKALGLMPTKECLAKSHTLEANVKRAKANMKPVAVNGVEYASFKDAALSLGISTKCIEHRINSNTKKFKDYVRL